MPNLYFRDPVLGEDINIDDLEYRDRISFYLIRPVEKVDNFKLCALVDLDERINFDPETRKPLYWPITREQIDGANKSILFSESGGSDSDGHERKMMRASPLTIEQLNAAFHFPPPGFDPGQGSMQFHAAAPYVYVADNGTTGANFTPPGFVFDGDYAPRAGVQVPPITEAELDVAIGIVAPLFTAEGMDFHTYVAGDEILRSQLLGNYARQTCSSLNRVVNDLHISLTTFLALDEGERSRLLWHSEVIKLLVDDWGMSLAQLVALDPASPPLADRDQFLQNPYPAGFFTVISLDQILALDLESRSELLHRSSQVCDLVNEAHMPIQNLIELNPLLRSELLRNSFAASTLVNRAGVSIQSLIDLDAPLRAEVLQNHNAIAEFVERGGSFADFIAEPDSSARSEMLQHREDDFDFGGMRP